MQKFVIVAGHICLCVGARLGDEFTERRRVEWRTCRSRSTCKKTHERQRGYAGRCLLQVQHGVQVRLAQRGKPGKLRELEIEVKGRRCRLCTPLKHTPGARLPFMGLKRIDH